MEATWQVGVFARVLGSPRTRAELVEAGAEWITVSPNQCTYLLEMSEAELESIGEELRNSGISVQGFHSYHGPRENLSDVDHNLREQAVEKHKAVIRRAPLVGAKVVHLHPGLSTLEEERQHSKTVLRSNLERSLDVLLPVAEESGVKLAVENMPLSYGSPEDLVALMEAFDSPWLGICFDTGHAHVRDGVKASLEVIGGHLVDLHINDNGGTLDLHLPPPYGTIDWPQFVSSLAEVGYRGPLILETIAWHSGLARMLQETDALFHGELAVFRNHERWGYVRCGDCGHVLIGSADKWNCGCKFK
ncbi:MAG: sugar phosphate isomerase/epimerase [Firmicutes bacterium]|nr:sugar phosphate isomerase/epimerase [Bacillota bacterium]